MSIEVNRAINEVLETLIIDLNGISYLYNDHLLSNLKESSPGIYIIGKAEPIIYFGNKYSIHLYNNAVNAYEISDTLIQTNDVFNEVFANENIYDIRKSYVSDSFGNVVSNLEIIKKLKVNNPKLSNINTAIILTEKLLFRYLSILAPNNKTTFDVNKYLINPDLDKARLENYEEALEDLFKDIANFVRNNVMNLYFYKRENTTLTIQKGIDYRAYLWCLSQDELSNKF